MLAIIRNESRVLCISQLVGDPRLRNLDETNAMAKRMKATMKVCDGRSCSKEIFRVYDQPCNICSSSPVGSEGDEVVVFFDDKGDTQ